MSGESSYDQFLDAAFSGDVSTVKRLLKAGLDPNIRSTEDRTPLMQAAWMGNREVVELLIAGGADLEARDRDAFTALFHAAHQNRADTVEVLLRAGADPNSSDRYGRTPLICACQTSGCEAAALLLRYGADVNHAGQGNITPLNAAVGSGTPAGQVSTVRLLLDHGAEVNSPDEYGRTPLHGASGFGIVEIIEALLGKNAEIDAQDQDGLTPLMWALQIGHFPASRCLMDRGARIDLLDNKRWSTLFYAAATWEDRCSPLVKELLDKGLAAEQKDNSGANPVLIAAGRGNWRSLEMLLLRGGRWDCRTQYGETPIGSAARAASHQCVQVLLAHGADPNIRLNDDKTPLHLAAQAGRGAEECVRFLIRGGADPEALDGQGNSPIDVATRLGRTDMVSMMVAAGRTDRPETADLSRIHAEFHDAVRAGHALRVQKILSGSHDFPVTELYAGFSHALGKDDAASVRAMLSGGLDPNSKTDMGKPLLLDAVWERPVAPAVATALIEAGADPKVESPDGSTVLVWICGKADESFYHDRPIGYGGYKHELMESLAARLIDSGVDVNAANDDGETALLWAALKRRFPMVKLLLKNGAHPDAADKHGRTPLMHAVTRSNSGPAMTTSLLKHGANTLARDKDDRTPFTYAAGQGNEKVVELLLAALQKRSLRPRSRLKILSTACVNAASAGHAKIVRLLLHDGVSSDGETMDGKVALVEASARGRLEVVQELLENHASPDRPDADHQTPLCAAAHWGSSEIVAALLASGADPNLPGRYGLTPLMVAAEGAFPDMTESLLKSGADPNPKGDYGETPLIRLAMSAYTKTYPERVEKSVSILVKYGARVNACNDDYETPLLLAAGAKEYYSQHAEEETPGRIAAVKALLAAGADPGLVSRNDLKALDVARRLGFHTIADLLTEAERGSE